ncbi:MAG: hypothetical protein QOJ89_2599 [bacterium]
MHGWIEPFYERAEPAIEPGHIWSGQPIALPPRHGLKIGRIDPKDDGTLIFEVTGRGDELFGHPPIHSLGMTSDEALVLARATRGRPVIVLSVTAAAQELGTGGSPRDAGALVAGAESGAGAESRAGADSGAAADAGTAVAHAGTAVVVPLHAAARYDEDVRRRVSRYEFANAFYLPASERPRFGESVARLDHVQPVRSADLTEHRGVKLSADALDALVEWFVAYTTNRIPADSLILEYRREQLAGS